MRNIFGTALFSSLLLMISCDESRRGNDSNVNEEANEAAEELNADKSDDRKKNDADFVYEVVESNYAEIKLAQIAAQRSTDPSVKEIANTIVGDHTNALNEVKVLAQAINVPVQETDQAKSKLERFSDTSMEDFEKDWCKEMMDIHDDNIDKFEERRGRTGDPELKAWIDKTLQVLKAHYGKLEACHERVKEN